MAGLRPWRRGSAADRLANATVPPVGELGIDNDGHVVASNGVAAWKDLARLATISEATEYGAPLTAYGADPAGGDVDARPALDQALMAALQAGVAVAWLPMGAYRLKTSYNPSDRNITAGQPSLVLDKYLRGFTWHGGWGKIGYPPTGGPKYYAAPELIWYGPVGGVMWELDTVAGAAILGVAFRGRPATGSSNRAGIGLNISQRNLLVGAGLLLLERLTFNDLDIGVKFGEGQTTGAGNCDTTTFRDCTWQSVGIAVNLTHQQNLVYNFNGTSGWVGCTTIIKSTAGGYFNIDDLNANGCGGTGPDDWMFDLNSGRYTGTHKISRARLENNCKQILRTNAQYTEVIFEGLTEAQDNQAVTMFDLTGGTVTLIGGKLSTHDATNSTFSLHAHAESGAQASVRLYGVRLDTPTFLFEEWFDLRGGFPAVTMRDCETAYGTRIPSFSTRLEDGLPVPLRAVTTNGTTTVSTTLLNNNAVTRSDNCCAIPVGAYRIRMLLVAMNGTALQVRAGREMDVVNDGTTLTMSTPEVVGTDYNPDALTFSVVAAGSYKHVRALVQGKASTTITWRAEFQFGNGASFSGDGGSF